MKRKITIEVNTETSGITVEYGNELSAELVLGVLRLATIHEEELLRELWQSRRKIERENAEADRQP